MGSSMTPYMQAAKAGVNAITSGVGAYFDTKTAKATARAQARIAEIQGQSYRTLARYQAEGLRSQGDQVNAQADVVQSNRIVQDIENRQMLQRMGRQQSALTASYKDVQGANAAQAAAGNVDISSGSAARVAEGNTFRYAQEVASMRRAYDLQRWQGESTLAMMGAQARGLRGVAGSYDTMAAAQEKYGEYMGQGQDIMTGAYRTVARLQGSAFGNALTAGSLSLLGSFLGGSFDGLFSSKTQTQEPIGYNRIHNQPQSFYDSMGI